MDITCECGHSLDKHCVTCGCDAVAAEGYCGCQRSPQTIVDATFARLTAERDAALAEVARLLMTLNTIQSSLSAQPGWEGGQPAAQEGGQP